MEEIDVVPFPIRHTLSQVQDGGEGRCSSLIKSLRRDKGVGALRIPYTPRAEKVTPQREEGGRGHGESEDQEPH